MEVTGDRQHTRLGYRAFPDFDDPTYEELTVSRVRAILRRCTGTEPDLSVERVTHDELDLRVALSPDPG